MKTLSICTVITLLSCLTAPALAQGNASASGGPPAPLRNHTGRVSIDSLGTQGDKGSTEVSMTADGRFVCFSSVATNLVPGDTNGWEDVFVHDRLNGTTARVSVDSAGVQ